MYDLWKGGDAWRYFGLPTYLGVRRICIWMLKMTVRFGVGRRLFPGQGMSGRGVDGERRAGVALGGWSLI